MHASLPLYEAERLAALHELGLLDTEPSPEFDALTRLVATLLDVPIAVVSLVDADRQWFKSRQGLDAPETSREVAFCAHAILDERPLVVPDATADRRFADNPLVTDGIRIRAYAGVPLHTPDGHAVGTLCAIDQKPRVFSARELQILEDLAAIARREIEARHQAARARAMAERSLRAQEAIAQLYHATVDCAGIGIAMVDLDGSWLRINPKMAQILGRSADELLMLTFQDITHPEDLDTDLGLMRQLLDGRADNYTLEKRYLRPDGSIVWGNLTVTLVREDDGRPRHFVALVEDITLRRAAEESLRQLRHDLEERVRFRTSALRHANDMLAESVQQLRASERALSDSRADLQAVLASAHDAYICVNAAGLVIEWNRQAEFTFGWTRREALGRRMDELIIPLELREPHRQGMDRMNRTGEAPILNRRIELPGVRRDGTVFPCELSITALQSQSQGRLYAAFLRDISERHCAQKQLADSHARLEELNRQQSLMLESEMIGIAKVREHRVVWCNAAFERLFGYGPGELLGQGTRAFHLDDETFEHVGQESEKAFGVGGTCRIQLPALRRQGEPFWVEMNGALLSAASGESLWMMQDITAMKRHQAKVEQMAFHDALTGLPNRTLLLERLGQALSDAQRSGTAVAVGFADLNGFKAVNDQHGHDAGDVLLRTVSQRLAGLVRRNDTVARLGGDEFVVVLTGLGAAHEAEAFFERARREIAQPVRLAGGASVAVSASFGLAFGPLEGGSAEALICVADARMYGLKRQRA